MSRKLWSTVCVAGLLMAAAACNKKTDDSSLSQKDKDFMDNATYVNLGQLSAANLVVPETDTPLVKSYANTMVADYATAQQQLAELAATWNRSLPIETNQHYKDLLTVLDGLSGRAFDSTYLYMTVSNHDSAIALHQDEADNGQDVSVKNYASGKLTVIKRHRELADSIAHALYP